MMVHLNSIMEASTITGSLLKRQKKSYDYNVNTAEDLAKLYLEPHMAKFTGN